MNELNQERRDRARNRIKKFSVQLRKTGLSEKAIRIPFIFATAERTTSATWRDIVHSAVQEANKRRTNDNLRSDA